MPLSHFSPLVASWFASKLGQPTLPQRCGWPAIAAGRHTLIAAPTGSGKTLAAFLFAIDQLLRRATTGMLPETTFVVYVSPLKALSSDVRKNLEEPLAELYLEAMRAGHLLPPLRVGLRTGDTPAAQRQQMVKLPPHILVTTPESLHLCLTALKSRANLAAVRTVIIDEVHALMADKRGAHLSLSLERLDALCRASGQPAPQRIGLSATVHPIAEVARYLVGAARVCPDEDGSLDDGCADCYIVDARRELPSPPPLMPLADAGQGAGAGATEVTLPPGLLRQLDLAICTPNDPLQAVCSNEQWQDVHDQMAALITAHKTTLVFVSTRRMAERIAHSLAERLGDGEVMAHHGSLSRGMRLRVEDRLKKGELKAVVATASLELGIDIGAIDLVCQVGSPRSISAFLQRVGRANHRPDAAAVPRGRLFAMTRDELVECAALLRAAAAGQLDRQHVPEVPLDVAAQQIVALCATEEQDEAQVLALLKRAWPFRNLTDAQYQQTLQMLAEGVATRRGRPSAHLHWDRVNGKLRGRRGAHLYVIQNGGTIPEPNDYEVVTDPEAVVVGRLDEEFVVESSAGDVFLLGSTAWRLKHVAGGKAYVVDAGGAAPTVPFWQGEAPGRTRELSQAVAELRAEVEAVALAQEASLTTRQQPSVERQSPKGTVPPQLTVIGGSAQPALSAVPVAPSPKPLLAADLPALQTRLQRECGLTPAASAQLVDYLLAARRALGRLPTQTTLVAERFFDEGGGMQLVLHMPFGARQNRAFGLSLRKKFCRTFNFELQAAATDDGVLLSLGETHSFPLETVWQFLNSARVEQVLSQAVLGAPVFQPHFRHVATRALQIPRMRSGKKLPPPIVRILTEDLLAAVFPNAAACPENLPGGDIEIPDHPLIVETLKECLREIMDLDGLRQLLLQIEAGTVTVLACDTSEPSPLAHHLLAAAPYAFLDDTPAEERRTRAVSVRRGQSGILTEQVMPHTPESGLCPEAVALVRSQAFPQLRDADELHDALLGLYVLPQHQLDWSLLHRAQVAELQAARRVCVLQVGSMTALCASERAEAVRAMYQLLAAELGTPPPTLTPEPPPLASSAATPARCCEPGAEETTLIEVVRGWLASTGPWDPEDLGFALGVQASRIFAALLALEAEGMALRGRFLPSAPDQPEPHREQFCDRRLLLRIHRQMQQKFRRSIETATPAQLWQLLARWQHAWPGTQLQGGSGLLRVLHKLQGFVAGAASWEEDLLPLRVRGFTSAALDALCLSGEIAWGRLKPGTGDGRLSKSTPISLWKRADADFLVPPRPPFLEWLAAVRAEAAQALPGTEDAATGPRRLSLLAEAAGEVLAKRGARFFAELCRDLGRPAPEIAAALSELCAAGLVTSDGLPGLRLLLGQAGALPGTPGGAQAALAAGRWSLIEGPSDPVETALGPVAVSRARFRGVQPVLAAEADWDNPALLEAWANQYLLRYGVVLRELCSREPLGPPLYLLMPMLRRLEARGLLRSGYFVAGLSGEQFATPEALEGLKLVRKLGETQKEAIELRISPSDPLNLCGILFPGHKVSSSSLTPILFRNGQPVLSPDLGVVAEASAAEAHSA